jgi:hypothetical protein
LYSESNLFFTDRFNLDTYGIRSIKSNINYIIEHSESILLQTNDLVLLGHKYDIKVVQPLIKFMTINLEINWDEKIQNIIDLRNNTFIQQDHFIKFTKYYLVMNKNCFIKDKNNNYIYRLKEEY